MRLLKVVVPVLFLLFFNRGFAQIRHVRGIKSVDAYYLSSRFGSGGGISYVKYFANTLYGKGSVFLEEGNDSGLSYRSFGGDIIAARTFVHAGHKFYLNGLGGIMVSVDAITKGGEQFNIHSEFKTGGLVGIEGEMFITDKLVFVFSWTQRLLIREAFGNYRWFGTTGIRFNL